MLADTGNHRVQLFTATGDFIQAWGSHGSEEGQFDHLNSIDIAGDDSVYVASQFNRRIQQFDDKGVFVRS